MGNLAWILISSSIVNNFTLTLFLGLCSFFGVTNRLETALRLGAANIFVLVLTSFSAWFLNRFILAATPFLRLISFIIVIASLVQIVEMAIKKWSPTLYRQLGIYLPLITTNCAVLGVCLININENYNFLQMVVSSFAYPVGFGLALVMFAGVRERILLARTPKPFQDTAIGLVTAGKLSLTFFAFKGWV